MEDDGGFDPLLGSGAPSPPPELELGGGGLGGEERPGASSFTAAAPYYYPAVEDFDLFIGRLYRYWESRGLAPALAARAANLAALALILSIYFFLLYCVDYGALRSAECLRLPPGAPGACSVAEAAVRWPGAAPPGAARALGAAYLLALAAYVALAAVHLALEAPALFETRRFASRFLGYSDAALRAAPWPEVVARLVGVQATAARLCRARDFTEWEVAAALTRKEDFLTALLDAGALELAPPWRARAPLLTRSLEWSLHWCLLDPMFDARRRLRRGFLQDRRALARRFRAAAAAHAAAAPFLLAFLLLYFFLREAEGVYHRPGGVGERAWAPAARWRLREFLEPRHALENRLAAGAGAAGRYLALFPAHVAAHAARLAAFAAGAAAALLLALAAADESLLERDLAGGRQTLWWLALAGAALAAARGAGGAGGAPPGAGADPELALLEVAAHTHDLPARWRGRGGDAAVAAELRSLFRYRAVLLLEEAAAVVAAPWMLATALARGAPAAADFVLRHAARVEGLGDVCALAALDPGRHGSRRYGGVAGAHARARQGKLEKSLVSFAATHPGWPPAAGGGAAGGGGGAAAAVLDRVARAPAAAAAAAAALAARGPLGAGARLASRYPHLARVAMGAGAGFDFDPGFDRSAFDPGGGASPSSVGAAAAARARLWAGGGLDAGAGAWPPPALAARGEAGRVAAAHALLQARYETERAGEALGGGAVAGGEAAAAAEQGEEARGSGRGRFCMRGAPPGPRGEGLAAELSVLGLSPARPRPAP